MSFLARVAPRLANTARAGSNSRAVALPRSFTTSIRVLASGPPVIQGEGGKVGEVATDEEQSTGLERFELLGRLQGKDVFDLEPLDASRLGTKKAPVMIQSLSPTRIVGCTGSPAGAHDTIWLHLNLDLEHHRCPECGSVYQLDFTGDPHAGHH
ncbi:hypothetical protein CBS101457_000775 [Exobasidium rhododendri]|nr:hypothetical protein CBS101457_000775 [Exobasidium rhododendri]